MTILLTTKEAQGQVRRLIAMNVGIKGTTRGIAQSERTKVIKTKLKVPCRAESSHSKNLLLRKQFSTYILFCVRIHRTHLLLEIELVTISTKQTFTLVLFVKKKDGSFRMCIDYRELNKLTVKNRYPLPRINDLFDQLQGSSVYSKIDLRSGYHLIEGCGRRQFEVCLQTLRAITNFHVMPLGLTNAPAVFMNLMNRVCKPYLDKFVIVFIDDIMIYSKNEQEHKEHLKQILELLKKEELYAKFSKCEFWIPKVQFLGHVIDSEGIQCGIAAKIESFKDWTWFSKIAKPMTKLNQKKVKFVWGDKQTQLFTVEGKSWAVHQSVDYLKEAKIFIATAMLQQKGLGAVLMREKNDFLCLTPVESP
ncbi:putative reverse transcriptase domain-containing protein [Tanacetum coccineum]